MKSLFLTFGFLIQTLLSFSQISSTSLKIEKLDNSVLSWTLLTDQQGLSIEYQFIDCDPEMGYDVEKVVLRYTNKTENSIQLKWHMVLFYNDVCKTCDYLDEYTYVLNLKPGEIIYGDCSLSSDYRANIFSKFLDSRYKGNSVLTNFEFKDFQVISIN